MGCDQRSQDLEGERKGEPGGHVWGVRFWTRRRKGVGRAPRETAAASSIYTLHHVCFRCTTVLPSPIPRCAARNSVRTTWPPVVPERHTYVAAHLKLRRETLGRTDGPFE